MGGTRIRGRRRKETRYYLRIRRRKEKRNVEIYRSTYFEFKAIYKDDTQCCVLTLDKKIKNLKKNPPFGYTRYTTELIFKSKFQY